MKELNFNKADIDEGNMTDLTEQWKKGELPSGWYYYKSSILGNITIADSLTLHKYRNRLDWKGIITILAKVPSYDELQNMNKAVNECMTANIKLVEENTKLKELLKGAKEIIEWYKADCGYRDIQTEVTLQHINNILGEDE